MPEIKFPVAFRNGQKRVWSIFHFSWNLPSTKQHKTGQQLHCWQIDAVCVSVCPPSRSLTHAVLSSFQSSCCVYGARSKSRRSNACVGGSGVLVCVLVGCLWFTQSPSIPSLCSLVRQCVCVSVTLRFMLYEQNRIMLHRKVLLLYVCVWECWKGV